MAKSHRSILLAAAFSLLAFGSLEAQVRRGRTEPTLPRWAPTAVGVRVGYDEQARGEVLGVQFRVPIARNGVLEFVPNAEMVWVTGNKEYQYNLELAVVPGGLNGGLIFGGGAGWRDTVIGSAAEDARNTIFGWVLSVGGKTGLGPIQIEALLKWTWLADTDYRPASATLGVNYPFWTVGGPERGGG
jgi:hypothetical protein